jgi:hypothetical protein
MFKTFVSLLSGHSSYLADGILLFPSEITFSFCPYQVVTAETIVSSHPDDTEAELSGGHRHYPATSGVQVGAKTDILKTCSVFIRRPIFL